ncbi:IncA family protein [Chlamydia pneumoniae LPCoLN]|uniref:IncA family protein n=1 Tax=Chlamydia pneumoniae TaxID=83558 RepID=UPI0001BD9E53|nr:IncA family protein [Chlamydia pneumoniae]ACZ32984.1 IncA family protein [Chlamydia pneumoniae LPCoLN]
MLLLISGALFLTLGIPGLTAGVSFGLGIGLSALGGVLVVSGLLCLLAKREVSKVCPEEIPTVRPEEIPEGVPVTPFEKPALDEAQKVQKILDQLPQELDQLDRYIQEVFACLGPLKDLKYEDQGFLKDVKEELRVFDFVQKDMIAEFVELQQILCQEGWFLESIINQTLHIGKDLFIRRVSLFKLWEWLGYLPSGDARGERLKKSAREVVDRFMRATCNIRKIAMTFDRHVYSVAKTAFEKAFGALETCVYESMRERSCLGMRKRAHMLSRGFRI